jgi:phosphate/sulfate permease
MEYLWVLAPSLGVGILFYFVMKAIFNADRKEREALAEAEREAERRAAEGREE